MDFIDTNIFLEDNANQYYATLMVKAKVIISFDEDFSNLKTL